MATRVKSENEFEKGRRGVADIVRLSADNMRIDFSENEELKQPAESFNVVVSFGEDGTVPDYFPFKKMKDGQRIDASVTMNADGSKILFAVPANGYFEVKFDQFVVTTKDAPPVIETKKGKKNTYGQFACLFEINGGDWQGLKIKDGVWAGARYWFRLYDNFTNVDGFLAVRGSGSGSDNLSDFLDATVGGGETIPYSENPLPEIQKLAQEENRRFFVNVAKGWVIGIVVPLSLADESLVEDDETIGFSEEQKENVEIHPALKD